jgi:hypothetical protein
MLSLKQSSRFFEKKLRKKLFLFWSVLVKTPVGQIDKRFLVLFFKKELLA